MGASLAVPASRWRWVQDGDTLDVGDRTLHVVRPPVYDSGTTRGLFDPLTRVYWGSDAFASPMTTPVRNVADLDPEPWAEGIHTFARYISPWLSLVDEGKFQRTVDRIEALQPLVIAGCHTPAIDQGLSRRPSPRPAWRPGRPSRPSPTSRSSTRSTPPWNLPPEGTARRAGRRRGPNPVGRGSAVAVWDRARRGVERLHHLLAVAR